MVWQGNGEENKKMQELPYMAAQQFFPNDMELIVLYITMLILVSTIPVGNNSPFCAANHIYSLPTTRYANMAVTSILFACTSKPPSALYQMKPDAL